MTLQTKLVGARTSVVRAATAASIAEARRPRSPSTSISDARAPRVSAGTFAISSAMSARTGSAGRASVPRSRHLRR